MSADPPDDPSVNDEEALWRRLPSRQNIPNWYERIADQWRPTSVAFLDNRNPTHSLSAYVSSETDLQRLLGDYPTSNVAEFLVRVPRQFDHTIQREPDAGYDSHVVITPPSAQWGREKSKRNQRKTAANAMAKSSEWVHFEDE